jgi:site-specific recombinase XerD
MTQYWRGVCAERCKHGSEGGCRKRAIRDTTRRYLLAGQRDKRHLAGILPYLRHSAATLLLSMGVHVKVVQEILGHSTITMTADIYSHVLPSMQEDAMGKWDDEFGV